MKKSKKVEKTELLHLQLLPEIKDALRDDAKKRGISMSGLICNLLFERYNPHSQEVPF